MVVPAPLVLLDALEACLDDETTEPDAVADADLDPMVNP